MLLIVGAAIAAPAGATVPASGDWYLAHDHAADAQAELPPSLTPVRVAVLDSGIDGGHPAFAGLVVDAKSFIGGNPLVDNNGHGTFIAGEIIAVAAAAAATANRASPVQLLVGKITEGVSIEPLAEARAIHWAVDNGAHVINLSLGGLRDPHNLALDTYSSVEAAAVRYAIAHQVVVVAAAGNSDEAPSQPWPYASWPAALPHVIGVGALAPGGSVPGFSNRDPVFADVSAPGVGLVSTFPLSITSLRPSCVDQGYSDCGTADYANPEGTSFAAPQVSAAAALLIAVNPQLTPDQVAWLLERNADDANPQTGCSACSYGRDALSGWGTLDIAKAIAALSRPFPPASPYEPTNDAGTEAHSLKTGGSPFTAVLDYWDNPLDVYSIHLSPGDHLWVRLAAPIGAISLALWKPGTVHVQAAGTTTRKQRIMQTTGNILVKRLDYRAEEAGFYYLELDLKARGNTTYTLSYTITHAR